MSSAARWERDGHLDPWIVRHGGRSADTISGQYAPARHYPSIVPSPFGASAAATVSVMGSGGLGYRAFDSGVFSTGAGGQVEQPAQVHIVVVAATDPHER